MEATPAWRLEWDESLSVCIPEIDSEHRRFIRMVNDLNEAIVDRLDHAELQRGCNGYWTMQPNISPTKRVIKRVALPGCRRACDETCGCYPSVERYHEPVEARQCNVRVDRCRIEIKDDLIAHILIEDMKFRDFCCASGNQVKGG